MRNARQWNMRSTAYPAVRRVMGPDRHRLSDAELEQRLERLFPDAEPEDVENFMRTVQNFGNQAAPLAQRALPGVIQGASTGAVAGPWGALAGGLAGGAMSLIGGGGAGRPPGAPPPSPPPAAPMSAPGLAPMPTPVVTAPTGGIQQPAEPNAAAAQLLALLSRPETMQALLSILMAGSGRTGVPVGNQSVPPAAFANAVSEMAAEVTERAAPSHRARISDYLVDDAGTPRCDVANPRSRAALLFGDIASIAAAEAAEYDEDDRDAYSDADEDAGESAIDSYEAALRGEETW